MDEERRIRFLVPPIPLFASLGWGALQDPCWQLREHFPGLTFELQNTASLIALLAGGGIAVFALGFLIGTITYVLLRFGFMVFRLVRVLFDCRYHSSDVRNTSHEVYFGEDVLQQVWRQIGAPGEPRLSQELFAGVAFDH